MLDGAYTKKLSTAVSATFVPCRKVEALDTVGAGDSFTGALAHCVASGASVLSAVRAGCAVATVSVLSRGTQTSYPKKGELPADISIP